MSGMMRYDHLRMADHATQQAGLVAHMQDLQQDANNQIVGIADIWTQHGSNAAQELHAQIGLAFSKVFETINRHGSAIASASQHGEMTDLGAAAGFRAI
jgi:uncharacterized protein YukE